MKKIISFSLWGEVAKYNEGAVKNAILCREIYRDWIPRFYVGATVPLGTLRRLRELDAEIVEKSEPGDWRGMFWRFEAASDPAVEIIISRDCDSRLSLREAAAVEEWVKSQAPFHIMRDHPAHCAPILGGMWGVKAPLLRDLSDRISRYAGGDFWQVDQDFLREAIFPGVRKIALIHDEFFGGKRFPTPRRGLEFVGQVFDEDEKTSVEDQQALARALDAGVIQAALRRLQLRRSIRRRPNIQ
jgi:hypothetical protein